MYGLLCESLHDFIKESYGDDVWKLVRERADVRLHSFVTHQVRDCVFKILVFIEKIQKLKFLGLMFGRQN